METIEITDAHRKKLYKLVLGLAFVTILYNVLEGLISVYIGLEEESFTLFGFGIDSFIEVISGIGIGNMILRIQHHPDSNRNDFERRALRITGFAFYGLAAGLIITSIYNVIVRHNPDTTIGGIIISMVSIVIMWLMILLKTKWGKLLNSDAIIADAACARVCMYMSLILLLSSLIYHYTHIGFVDSLGTLGLSYLSYKEGKECFEKAANNNHCTCNH